MRFRSLSFVSTALALGCAAPPAAAAVYDFTLTGQVANGSTSIFTSGGRTFNIFTLNLDGFGAPFDLMVGDILNLNVTLDDLVTVPASGETFFGVDALTTPQQFALLDTSAISSSSLTPLNGDFSGQTFFGSCSNCISATASLGAAPSFRIGALNASITIENLSPFDPGDTSPVTLNGFAFRYQAADAAGAVPEPRTWAIMVVGFGMVGGTLRRRKRASQPVLA